MALGDVISHDYPQGFPLELDFVYTFLYDLNMPKKVLKDKMITFRIPNGIWKALKRHKIKISLVCRKALVRAVLVKLNRR